MSTSDAERVLARRALQPTIEIDLVRLQKEGFLTPQNQRSLIAEEYRIIKRPLLRSAFDRTATNSQFSHVVMVTSCKPGDGKTFTSINLAMSVASERDLYVLLIDCDIRRMDLSRKLGIADRKGIMDVLLDPKLAVADVMLRTNIPNLAVIPSGQPVEAATELFASQSMTKLVDEIASRYQDRFIIFDTPPILASSEPGVLALHVGHVIMVVSAGETTKAAINEALPMVNACPNVHFILNRATMAGGRDRFGYYGQY
ncbi:MAG: XrtA-associated tyrosine autokinase [Rhodospirillaceae bacterium]|nr:XrtA-associated tyrosine autokinase [Rhodospirillaceae bacterium]